MLCTHTYLQTKHICDLIFLEIKTWYIIINIGSNGNIILWYFSKIDSLLISKEMSINHLSLWGRHKWFYLKRDKFILYVLC